MTKVRITNPDGSTFYSCECVRSIWPELNELLRKKGLVKKNLDVTQGSYNTSVRASAKTHFGGGVLDIVQTGQAIDDVLEEAGFAAYVRTPADGFSYHSHIVKIDCPHLHQQAANQVTAWKNRRNGLVSNREDRDQTRPSTYRNTTQALLWIREQLGRGVAKVTAPAKKVVAPRTGSIYTAGQGRPISFSVTMRNRGKPNGNVKIIQTLLQAQKPGGKSLYSGPIDGIYGPQTKAAVAKYQQALGYRGKAADGILGWQTFSRLVTWAGWKAVR